MMDGGRQEDRDASQSILVSGFRLCPEHARNG
jgi:hypothetical protein